MKNYKIKILTLVLFIVIISLFIPQKVNAGIQANKGGTSLGSTTASDFFSQIRTMEGTYGTLGVSPDNSSTSTYNGIDAHMAKNTEWGTAAMLAVSSYGSNSNNTTTGNSSGIYNMANEKNEYTANYIAGSTQSVAANIKNAATKYKNEYASNSTRITGDALSMGSLTYKWDDASPVIARGNGNLFKYIACTWYYSDFNYTPGGSASGDFGSRACVVMGANL